MPYICDLHVHSKYSRATSRDMDIENLSKWAKIKGIGMLGTGDFTHPAWLKELKEKLDEKEYGIYSHNGVNYVLSAEVSNIYFKNGKVRKIHNVVIAPSFAIAEEINKMLAAYGTLESDGRPMLSLECDKMAKSLKKISGEIMIIPAHIWTPHFSLFGSNSGFDTIEECFEAETPHITALETGLSSNPSMNWRLSALDKYTLVSNSDAHCVHPETSIYNVNGKPIAIEDLNSSKALSIDFAGDLKQKESRISKLHKLPSPPILYEITSRTKEIVTTVEHRFFVLENEEIVEKQARKLKKGDLVACLRELTYEGKSKRLPSLDIDHEVKILPEGTDYLRRVRIKNKKTQKNIGKYIGVKEGCVWIFEKHKVKTPKESFIDKYCGYLKLDKNRFKRRFIIDKFPSEKTPKFSNEQFCQILGYAIGDGGIEHRWGKIQKFSITDKNTKLLDHYENLIRKVFNIEGKLRKKRGNSNCVRYPPYLAEYFQKIDPKILTSSPKRLIPEFVFNLPKREIGAFLRGLFDAEGAIAHHSIQISSSSLDLIKDVQILLMKFGINSNIYHDFKKIAFGNNHNVRFSQWYRLYTFLYREKNKKKWRYKLSIYGQEQLRIFIKEIGFNSIPKQEKLFRYLSSLHQRAKTSFVDSLPMREEISKVKKELAVSSYDMSSRLYYHLNHADTLKRENVKEFMGIFANYIELQPQKNSIVEKLKRFAESDIIWEDIQEVRKIKSDCKYVYDLTIPNYENYVANGFITHNSPSKIGREANVFKEEIGYKALKEILEKKDKDKFLYTVEFFPQEGKYHWDGHRKCEARLSPKESAKINYRCPTCGRRLTVGVMNRVEKLADRPEDFVSKDSPGYKSMIPLVEIIADTMGVGKDSLGAAREYNLLVQRMGSEFHILLFASEEDILEKCPPKIAKAIINVRKGKVNILPGYDGVYGKIEVFGKDDRKEEKQLTFF